MASLAELVAPAKAGVKRKRPSTRDDQTAERRLMLLDAAVSVIAKRGLTGITVQMIANAAGCSYGVVAFHFKSKSGIILAALDHLVDQYETIRQPKLEVSDEARCAASRLMAMVDSDFDPRVSGPRQVAVWAAFWAEAVRVKAYRDRCAELKDRYFQSTRTDVAVLAKARGLAIDPAQVAVTLNAIIDGIWIANLVRGVTATAGRDEGRAACLAYLKTIFPGDF